MTGSGLDVRPATEADRADWDAFVARRPEGDPLQLWAWGEAWRSQAETPLRLIARDRDGAARGLAGALVRGGGFGRSIAYVPHGPLWDREAPDADDVLGALFGGLVDAARRSGVIVVKVDPRVGADLDGAPVAGLLRRHGLRPARHDIQVQATRIVELLDGGDELWRTWDRDARTRVRRGRKEGATATVHRAADQEAIGAFVGLLETTADRAHFQIRAPAFYERLATELAATNGWYLSLTSFEGRVIAGQAMPRVGDRAFYLYGGSRREPELRHAFGSYVAMAAAMAALAADGVRTLDLWGVAEPDDHDADPSWAGYSEFKRRFGGRPIRQPGTFDLVVDPLWHGLRDARERLLDAARRRRR